MARVFGCAGSHIQPVTVDPDARNRPHPDEVLVRMKAGDVVLVHNGLIHSGTPNTSGQKRYFQTVFYNCSWMKQTDTFDGPNCQLLKRLAERHNDHRALRYEPMLNVARFVRTVD
jgi:ectoine hydroxylase-related dioxygenase (phytanoyl-CoA dioxygenase family)